MGVVSFVWIQIHQLEHRVMMNKFLYCNFSEGSGAGPVPGAAGTVWQNNGGGGFTGIHRAEQSNKIQAGRTRQELSTAGGSRREAGGRVWI